MPTASFASLFASRPTPVGADGHIRILDGWRALSITFVLIGHWLPVNAVLPGGNEAIAATGMNIFFFLSGFLITRILHGKPDVRSFLIRRLFRIVPLAWAAMLALYVASGDGERLLVNLLFHANLPPIRFLPHGEFLWSLCLEVQAYLTVAALVAVAGRRGLFALPVLAVAVTVAAITAGEMVSVVTWHRADELLAGATVALIYLGAFGERPRALFARLNFYLLLLVAAACCYWLRSPIGYARPYAVAALVGSTLWNAPRWLAAPMTSRAAVYLATVSYAVYVFHGLLWATWLGTGDTLEKYLKRPLLLAATLACAHVSTFYYERRFTDLGRALSRGRAPAVAG